MPEITEADRERAMSAMGLGGLILREDIHDPAAIEQRDVIARALADQRAALSTELAERVRAIRDAAWQEGYQACYRGEQRHSPYRAPRSEEARR